MKISRIIYSIFAISFLLACNEAKKDKITEPIEIDTEKEFLLKLNVLVKKDDTFELFYTQDEVEKFSPEQLIRTKVKGSNSFQYIVFKLPKDDYPYNLRLDLGTNKAQTKISITECVLSYSNSNFKIKGNSLNDFFSLNNHIELEQDSLTYRLSTAEGKYDPFMIGSTNLIEALTSKI